MKKTEKNFDTGLRIVEVLKILLEKDVSKNEIIEEIKNNSLFENVYTPEVFIKYFNTLEILGLNIERRKNIYRLKNVFEKLALTKDEYKMLVDLIGYTKKLHNKNLEKSINNIFKKLIKYTDEKIQSDIINAINKSNQRIYKNPNFIKSLESLLYEEQIISVTYCRNNKTQETISVELREIIEKNNDITLVCYDIKKSRNKKIPITSIISIKQLPNKASKITRTNSVIFRIYGRLADVYKLKPAEKTLDFSPGCITISNYGEDKDVLIRRLLKYGENCEIIQPQNIKEEFLTMTDEILKNLEKETFNEKNSSCSDR